MDFKAFEERTKARLQSIVEEMKIECEKFWEDLLEDLNRQKLLLEQQIEKLKSSKGAEEKEKVNLSAEVIKLNDKLKELRTNTVKYEKKHKEMVEKIIEIEAKETDAIAKEEELNARKVALDDREDVLITDQKLFTEKQARLERYSK